MKNLEKDEILLYVIIAGIIAAVIGAGIGYLLRRRIAEARIGSAEEKAAQLVASAEKERENALREAETLKKETMRPCIHVSQEWEKVWPRVNEGCFVIRRNGTYYMTYSANSYESPFYGTGCATADSPLGPWTKYDRNPLLQNPGELVGVGHSALFRDKAGNLKIVFHAHKSKGAIHPREMYITDVRFRPVEGGCRMEIDPGYSPALIAE